MNDHDEQKRILDEIREKVLKREREIQLKQDKAADIEATLQALEEITDVPREEMERIANEIRLAREKPEEPEGEPANRFDSLLFPVYQRDKLPATTRELLIQLPPVFQEEFSEEYAICQKSFALSYLFWLIPPPFSGHYFYLKRFFSQFLFSVTIGGFLIWWIVDLFRIPKIVQEENRKTARKILKRMVRQSLKRDQRKRRLPGF